MGRLHAAIGLGCIGWLASLPATAAAALIHQYTFNEGTANDSVGTANGTLMGGATVSGGQVHLSGASTQFVNLPGPTIAINTYTDATFEGWFTYNNSASHWQRLFDFGPAYSDPNPGHYLFYTPDSDVIGLGGTQNSLAEMAIFNSTGDRSRAFGGATLSPGVQHYVAVTFTGSTRLMSLYVDGTLKGSATALTPLLSMGNANAYLGASNYPSDPKLNGTIDEFDIYNTALDAATIAAHYAAGPVAVPEPSSYALAAVGLLALIAFRRPRRQLVPATRWTVLPISRICRSAK
jgi:hypothetical protein